MCLQRQASEVCASGCKHSFIRLCAQVIKSGAQMRLSGVMCLHSLEYPYTAGVDPFTFFSNVLGVDLNGMAWAAEDLPYFTRMKDDVERKLMASSTDDSGSIELYIPSKLVDLLRKERKVCGMIMIHVAHACSGAKRTQDVVHHAFLWGLPGVVDH